jgi:hypothetical protein
MLTKILISVIVMFLTACQGGLPAGQQSLSAGDLTAEYERSKIDARRKYDGKEISVRGYVLGEVALPKDDEYEGLITLEDETNSSSQVLCWFTRNDASKFGAIKGGQFATVKGVFNGERGAELRFCRLVSVE